MTTTMALARNTDPAESHDAAHSVNDERDRMKVLEAFRLFSGTYRGAAYRAYVLEGGRLPVNTARLESLRRRGSDLKKLGYIRPLYREGREMVFAITVKGMEALGPVHP